MTLRERIDMIRASADKGRSLVEEQIDAIVLYLSDDGTRMEPWTSANSPHCYCTEDWTDGTGFCDACKRRRK